MSSKNTDPKGGDANKLFFTTSDLMNTMNDVLKKLESPEDNLSPRFELQKRLPNGTTVKADERDIEVANMESKFKQAALEVEGLPPSKKVEWARKQRQEGNKLYASKKYSQAMDVYLTCLVAKSDDLDFIDQVFLPVMNNLAQCTLHLGFYKKTQVFCTMALDEKMIFLLERPEAVSKLYFRRAKAYRLAGKYTQAHQDLMQSKQLLAETSQESQAIEKELKMVEYSNREAKKNKKRQEQAMKEIFDIQSQPLVMNKKHFAAQSDTEQNPSERKMSLYNKHRRSYSALRAKEKPVIDAQSSEMELSYWEYYLAVIGSITERLLILLGDEESIAKEEDHLKKAK